MAAVTRGSSDDVRRAALSPKPKGRELEGTGLSGGLDTENTKDTLCRNVTIYGHCRYEDKGCAFNHDPVKTFAPAESIKKRFNVDSPSFTPASHISPSLAVNGTATKASGLSPKAASAAPFQPKGFGGDLASLSKNQYNPTAPDWSLGSSTDSQEFLPQVHNAANAVSEVNGGLQQTMYDTYATPSVPMGTQPQVLQQAQINPYTQEANATTVASYYQSSTFAQPAQYHLYAPLGPHRENLLPYQRAAYDFFIPDALREELQRKSAATLQVLPDSKLPQNIDYFHSLVPLDTTNQKNAVLFGYPSWVYKAVSSKDGNTYALRRLEGYRLTNEKAIRAVAGWKRISNANIVTVIDAFTNRSFGDSSLMVVTDYHPLSKTLAEAHFKSLSSQYISRGQTIPITEQIMWGYLIQIANALKAIHGAGLAARIIDPTKILLTSKNRIRLNACAILDIVQYESPRTILELQREDLLQFGRLLLGLGTNNPTVTQNLNKAMEHFSRTFSPQLKDRVLWLLSMVNPNQTESIDKFLVGLETQIMNFYNSALHFEDELRSQLNRETENSRIVRLMTKINFIIERPEYAANPQWAEYGERYPIKLFRDFVFHQVDAQNNPVLDLGHVISCLNKLDAGVEEKIVLTTIDDKVVVVVYYKELKAMIQNAYSDLIKANRRTL